MITKIELDIMSKSEIGHLDSDRLADIQEVKIDDSLPVEQRLDDYIRQVKKPYAFRCGSVTVLLRFQPDGKDLSQSLADYFQTRQNHSL